MTTNQNDVDSLDGDLEQYDQTNEIDVNHYYEHIENGKRYEVMDDCAIKMPDGSWTEGVIYFEHFGFSTYPIYVRTKENFLKRMKKVELK